MFLRAYNIHTSNSHQLMSHGYNDLLPDVTLSQGTYIFTAILSDKLYEYLEDDFNFEMALRIVPVSEHLKIRNISNHKLRCKKLINSLFIRLLLNFTESQVLGHDVSPWKSVDLKYNHYGKPYFHDNQLNQTVSFSLSSSNNVVALALEIGLMSPIGIDLSHSEQNISPTTWLSDFKDIFHDSEVEQLIEIPNTEKSYVAFNQIWTLKEAFTKFIGSGLNVDLSKFAFELDLVSDTYGSNDVGVGSINKLNLNWSGDNTIDITNLKREQSEFVVGINNPLYCYSAVLLHGSIDQLPVIISIIKENSNPAKCNNIDFFSILHNIA